MRFVLPLSVPRAIMPCSRHWRLPARVRQLRRGAPAIDAALSASASTGTPGRRRILISKARRAAACCHRTGSEMEADSAERLGSALTARLLTSGDARRCSTSTAAGSTPMPRRASRLAHRCVRAPRPLSHPPQGELRPTLDSITIVGAPEGAEARWTGHMRDPPRARADSRARRRAGQYHLSRKLR